MDWFLLVVQMTQQGPEDQEPVRFATRTECMAAAQAFVERYPAFELIDRSGDGAFEAPVVRSSVECVSAEQLGARKEGKTPAD